MKTAFTKLLKESGLAAEMIDPLVGRILREIGVSTVPKTEFNAKIAEVHRLEESLKKKTIWIQNLEEKAGECDALKKEISEMRKQYDESTRFYLKQIQDLQFEYELDRELIHAGAIQPKAVRALIDPSKLQYVGKAPITGLERQIRMLKATDPYLFRFISARTGLKRSPSRFVRKQIRIKVPI